jgi:hypothetical protein
VVDGDGLGDLQEPDQHQPGQPMGAGLGPLHPRYARVHGRIGGNSPSMFVNRKNPHPVHHRQDRGVHQSALAATADV